MLVQTLIALFAVADRTHTLEVGAGATVADVKAVVAVREGERRRLVAAHCSPHRHLD